jgi:hypothetical protein
LDVGSSVRTPRIRWPMAATFTPDEEAEIELMLWEEAT